MIGISRVIVSNRLQNHDILNYFPSTVSFKFSSIILPDIIFCSGKVSIAFKLCSPRNNESLSEWCDSLNTLTQSFTHIYGIVYDIQNMNQWYEIQTKLKRGKIRIYLSKSIQQTYEFMRTISELLFDTIKLDIQKQYFQAEESYIVSIQSVQDILQEAFDRMNVSNENIQNILCNLQSMKHLFHLISSTNKENFPEWFHSVITFFSSQSR